MKQVRNGTHNEEIHNIYWFISLGSKVSTDVEKLTKMAEKAVDHQLHNQFAEKLETQRSINEDLSTEDSRFPDLLHESFKKSEVNFLKRLADKIENKTTKKNYIKLIKRYEKNSEASKEFPTDLKRVLESTTSHLAYESAFNMMLRENKLADIIAYGPDGWEQAATGSSFNYTLKNSRPPSIAKFTLRDKHKKSNGLNGYSRKSASEKKFGITVVIADVCQVNALKAQEYFEQYLGESTEEPKEGKKLSSFKHDSGSDSSDELSNNSPAGSPPQSNLLCDFKSKKSCSENEYLAENGKAWISSYEEVIRSILEKDNAFEFVDFTSMADLVKLIPDGSSTWGNIHSMLLSHEELGRENYKILHASTEKVADVVKDEDRIVSLGRNSVFKEPFSPDILYLVQSLAANGAGQAKSPSNKSSALLGTTGFLSKYLIQTDVMTYVKSIEDAFQLKNIMYNVTTTLQTGLDDGKKSSSDGLRPQIIEVKYGFQHNLDSYKIRDSSDQWELLVQAGAYLQILDKLVDTADHVDQKDAINLREHAGERLKVIFKNCKVCDSYVLSDKDLVEEEEKAILEELQSQVIYRALAEIKLVDPYTKLKHRKFTELLESLVAKSHARQSRSAEFATGTLSKLSISSRNSPPNSPARSDGSATSPRRERDRSGSF